jgi:phytanoyl-CoA hydroxylase
VQNERLRNNGYVVVPSFVLVDGLAKLNDVARAQLAARAGPLEFEARFQYPGAPPSRATAGGGTVRWLLDAYVRDPVFAEWGTASGLRNWMEAYFGETMLMSRAHNNCLMTKHPYDRFRRN